jgi:hypothetical protein
LKRKKMPYSKDYNEEKYIEIEKYLSQLETLNKGKVFSIPTSSPEEAEHLRWLFYDYFHLTGAKSTYTLKIFNNFLLIGKVKPTLANITTLSQGRDFVGQLNSVIQELIVLPAPRAKIAELVLDKSISFTTLSIILAEYGRVMGE